MARCRRGTVRRRRHRGRTARCSGRARRAKRRRNRSARPDHRSSCAESSAAALPPPAPVRPRRRCRRRRMPHGARQRRGSWTAFDRSRCGGPARCSAAAAPARRDCAWRGTSSGRRDRAGAARRRPRSRTDCGKTAPSWPNSRPAVRWPCDRCAAGQCLLTRRRAGGSRCRSCSAPARRTRADRSGCRPAHARPESAARSARSARGRAARRRRRRAPGPRPRRRFSMPWHRPMARAPRNSCVRTSTARH